MQSIRLIRCLQDKEINIRIGAAEVLGSLKDRRATGPLKNSLNDPFSQVREAAEIAIRQLPVTAWYLLSVPDL